MYPNFTLKVPNAIQLRNSRFDVAAYEKHEHLVQAFRIPQDCEQVSCILLKVK